MSEIEVPDPGEMSLQELRKILANPFYAVEIHPALFDEHEPLISEEVWIEAALTMIEEEGPKVFIHALIEALKDPVLVDGEPMFRSKDAGSSQP